MNPEPAKFAFTSCYASLDGADFTIGNELTERRWTICNGLLYAASILDKSTQVEWLAGPSATPAPCPVGSPANEERSISISAKQGALLPVEEPSLLVEITVGGGDRFLKYRFQIFPGSTAVRTQLIAPGTGAPASPNDATDEGDPTGIETGEKSEPVERTDDSLENFQLAPQHLRLTAVELVDQTDVHNELVFEREWLLHTCDVRVALSGNLFIVEDTLRGSGLIFLKHAPLPHARPVPCETDFIAIGPDRRFIFRGNGFSPEDGAGYPFALITYQGGRAGRIAALQNYQRQLRKFVPGRDGLFLSNTWGDRSRDARINEEFITREIEAGARLGVDVVQIDDGWQRGRTSNSALGGGVWNGFWAADPDFWAAHPERFPKGLQPVVNLARGHGMQFGLWFAPDSSDDFANWERDADQLLELHRTLGVCFFKIDGVKAHSRKGEQCLHRFFEKVLADSAGRVVFDLDVTAEIRPGYFGQMNCGPIFVENRYTDWHRYWPHQTLRNLWKLTQYVDPLRLRMEFLNNTRNPDVYPDDPLAPGCHRAGYLFATTMFSNPLGWFETSNLPAEYFNEVAPLARIWKEHRERVFRGRIIPIGEAPDGTAWTGFVSVDGNAGYALIFRELNGRPSWTCDMPLLPDDANSVTLLGGEGSLRIENKKIIVEIASPQQFLFVRFES